jgi:hypothetical protein
MAERFPKKPGKLPANPFARDLVQRIRGGEDTAETAQAHLRMVARAKAARAASQKRKLEQARRENPATAETESEQDERRRDEILARRRKEFIDKRIAEDYKVDDRIDIIDDEGNVIPNPHYGQRLDY